MHNDRMLKAIENINHDFFEKTGIEQLITTDMLMTTPMNKMEIDKKVCEIIDLMDQINTDRQLLNLMLKMKKNGRKIDIIDN